MGKICCILDSDESFAVRICACFNKKHVLPFSVQAFSDMDAYMSCAQNNEVELLIVDESLYEEARHVPAGQIIRLCEQPMLMEGEADACIVKFQASDSIIRDVLGVYTGRLMPAACAKTADKAEIVCIYSPNGYCGKTTLSLALAHIKGRERKVLYINLEEFSALGTAAGNLSDVLYYYHVNSKMCGGKIMSLISTGNGFDYIPPAACAKDILDTDAETIIGLTEAVILSGGYEMVIIDVGSLVKEPWKLLEYSDKILIPSPDSPHRQRRVKEFEKFMYTSGYGDTMEKVCMVDIVGDDSVFRDGSINYACLAGSVYAKAVGSIDV